jgi:hypothetical protein
MSEHDRWTWRPFFSFALLLALSLSSPALAQESNATRDGTQSQRLATGQSSQPPVQSPAQQTDQQSSGSIGGTVVDQTGAVVASAHVTLTRGDQFPAREAQSDGDGRFSFASIAPGPFRIEITLPGFLPQTFSGTLHSGEDFLLPQITLMVGANIDVVVLPQEVVAEAQLKQEEKQRVLGVVPNFYVSYIPDAAPLSSKQKFQLGWKSTFDPVNLVIIGGVAGIQQATNTFSGYGQGAQGYGKRYGATFADVVAGTFIASAILPSLLKQDPRYFYKGIGSKRSRLLYALGNAVICKGDNGRWQANYSNIFGNLAAGGVSNLYYPADDRGAALTFENALVGIGATAAANVIQEFLIRKLTPHIIAKPETPLVRLTAASVHEGA